MCGNLIQNGFSSLCKPQTVPETTGAAKKSRACLPCEDLNGVRPVSQASLCHSQLSSSGNSLFPIGSYQIMEGTRPGKERRGGREMKGFFRGLGINEGSQDRLLNPIKYHCHQKSLQRPVKGDCSPCTLAGSCCTDSGHMLCN